VESSPDNYALLFEDAVRKVMEMTLRAGQKDNEHSHTSEIVYSISGSSVKIHLPGGQTVEADIPDGHLMQHEPWTHTVENVGTKDIRAIIFETK